MDKKHHKKSVDEEQYVAICLNMLQYVGTIKENNTTRKS